MSQEKILHFDTVTRENPPLTDPFTVITYPFNYDHAYYCQLKVASPIANVKTVSLKSIEMPILWSNIRAENESNSLTFTFTYGTYTNVTVSILPINQISYTLSTLLTAINAKLFQACASHAGGGLTITLTADPIYPRVYLTTNATALSFSSGILFNNILGFTKQQTSFNSSQVWFAYNFYNLNLDNYVTMQIININSPSVFASGNSATFKIPINGITGSVIYFDENSGFKQIIENKDPNLILDKVIIRINDRWGFPIYPVGGDFSFTLGITYDEF